MSTATIDKKEVFQIDKVLLNSVISDVLEDYLELKEDENTRNQIKEDDSFKLITQDLKTTLWKL